jgi:hypothetical protein
VSSRRPCDSDAFATSSYGTNFAQPLSAATFVSAAVSVVFPWSMWPIVPTFTCGFERSNFSFAICLSALPGPRRFLRRASRHPAHTLALLESLPAYAACHPKLKSIIDRPPSLASRAMVGILRRHP